MARSSEPNETNGYLGAHVNRLIASLRHWTGRNLVDVDSPSVDQARQLFHARFVVLSHNQTSDPILNYANLVGLRLFELSWDELICLPSRRTAEPVDQDERARLLEAVTRQGYIDNYRGIRVSKTGRRFLIEQATVWNLFDESSMTCGQAATFSEWRYLD